MAFYLRRLADGPNGEPRAEVTPVKSRKGVAPAAFKIQLTDERGVELFGDSVEPHPQPAPPLADDDRVHAAIMAEPGCNRNRLAALLVMRPETVTEITKALERAGRIRMETGGKGRANAYFSTGPESGSGEVDRIGSDPVHGTSGIQS
jgi:hypothetical protein